MSEIICANEKSDIIKSTQIFRYLKKYITIFYCMNEHLRYFNEIKTE